MRDVWRPGSGFTLHDLFVVCRYAPPGSPVAEAIEPAARWTQAEHFLADLVDHAAVELWRDTDPAQRGAPPEQIRRPGHTGSEPEVKSGGLDIDEFDTWLAARRPQEA